MESIMLGWALTFLIVALVAAVLGFGGVAGLSIEIAKIIFCGRRPVPDIGGRRYRARTLGVALAAHRLPRNEIAPA